MWALCPARRWLEFRAVTRSAKCRQSFDVDCCIPQQAVRPAERERPRARAVRRIARDIAEWG